MNPEDDLLKLLADKKTREQKIKELSWYSTSIDIKELLVGEGGLYENDEEAALNWLIESRLELEGRSPIEVILDGKQEEIIKLVHKLNTDIIS